jgi:16S rRNA (guanine(966)-N(2))-methyltransferase RsmD
MRIIGGEKKGFVLKSPRGEATRPTLGRVRESLFGILGPEVVGARVLDLFAGSGALGLEALSRGALSCTFVEKSESALASLKANIEKLGYQESTNVAKADALRWLQMQKTTGWPTFTLAFCDPPYDTELAERALQLMSNHLPLELNSTVVIQTSPRETLTDDVGRLRKYRTQKYGDTVLHFYVCVSKI